MIVIRNSDFNRHSAVTAKIRDLSADLKISLKGRKEVEWDTMIKSCLVLLNRGYQQQKDGQVER